MQPDDLFSPYTHKFRDWDDLYSHFPISFLLLMICSFVFFTLMLRHLLVAVLVSFRKEMAVRSAAAFHPLWSGKDPTTYNPAKLKQA